MRLARLRIQSLRNLQSTLLECHPQFNFIIGKNGSGKTSLLEAVHMLALGRSFRVRQVQSVIAYQAASLACYGELLDAFQAKTTLGIEKSREGEVKCKLQGELCSKLSEFASVLPVQLVTPEALRLLTSASEERRRFLDWGVFHVEHGFAGLCQTYHRALKQRNAALKAQRSREEASHWERLLVEAGEQIALHRGVYMASLTPFIEASLAHWLPELSLTLSYYPGWQAETLGEALEGARGKDYYSGYTSVGPHRAEVSITIEGLPAHQVLSRGQQKLFIFALYLAQAQQLAKQTGKRSVFLVDDLAAELDHESRAKVLGALYAQGHQVFLTAIEASSIDCEPLHGAFKWFHVEHGVLEGA